MKRGIKTGMKVKEDSEYLKHIFHTAFTDSQFDELCKLASNWDLSFSAAIRNCVRIVCGMSDVERERQMRSVVWKD